MQPPSCHVPGPAPDEAPPEPLVALSERLRHPLVRRTGITCTTEGRWALYVTVDKTTHVPLPDLEAASQGYPVVYEAEPDEPLTPYGGAPAGD